MRIQVAALVKGEEDEDQQCSSSSSSSIGKNSDESSEIECGGGDMENEAQSAFKYNGSLDMMDSLQQVLPIRRGISKFYDGKSKSFTSLAEETVSSSPVKDIGKPDNAYTRRRRNLLAVNHGWEKNRNLPLSGGISKRTTMSSSRSALALAFAMNYDSCCSCCTSEESSSPGSNPASPLPPRYPRSNVSNSSASSGLSSPMHRNFSPWRSFSLVDLQNCATAATIKMQSSSMRNEAAHLSQ